MNYTELKKQFDSTRREQLLYDKKMRGVQEELKELDEETKSIMTAIDARMANDRAEALKEFRESQTRPIEEELVKKKHELELVQEEYSGKYAAISFDNIMSEFSDKQAILSEVKDASLILRDQLIRLLGQRFYDALCNRLEKVCLEERNLDSLIYYFNQSQKTLAAFESRDGSFRISDIEDAVSSVKMFKSVLAVVVLVVTVLFGRVVLPIFVLAIAVVSAVTITKNYQVCRILMIQKAVQDNIDAIEEHLKQQALAEVGLRQQQLTERQQPVIDDLEQSISQLEQKLFKCNAEVDHTFQYDESRVDSIRSVEMRKIDDRRSNLLINERTYKKQLEEHTALMEELSKEINELLGGLSKQYLLGVGSAVIFDPKFLLDVDTEKNKPIMFKHPQKSALFLYDSLEDAYNFIRLMCVELRAKINPFSLNIVAVDELNACQDLVYFGSSVNKTEDVSSLFKMVVNEEGIHKYTEQLASDLFRRQSNIRREFNDIETYNKRMVELDSLTEAYDFHFIVEPNTTLIQHQDFLRCMRIGDTMGVFLHVFISKKNFNRMKETAEGLLDVAGKVYYLQGGGCHDRAKDFVMEDLMA